MCRHLHEWLILLWYKLPARRSGALRRAFACAAALVGCRMFADAPELDSLELLWDNLDNTALANLPSEQVCVDARRMHAAMPRARRCLAPGRNFLRYTGFLALQCGDIMKTILGVM